MLGQNPSGPAPALPPGGTVTDRKRPQWTELTILALAAGEHDEFDRKSGLLIERPGLNGQLGKLLSSFATSMGGHIILGQRDDGTFDGVEPKRGLTPTREWLEQIIPARLDPPLADFRVHEVIPASPSGIPAGKVVIVIDVSESRSNHQSVEDGVYYHRLGGHSVPAPHRYLEGRRARLTQPVLVGKVAGIAVVRAYRHDDHLFVELKINVRVRNIGPVAETHWQFIPEAFGGLLRERKGDYVHNRSEFPSGTTDGGFPVGDRTLYPGAPGRLEQVDIGLRLRPATFDLAGIGADLDALFTPELAIEFKVASHVDGGTTVEGRLAPVLNRDALATAIGRYFGLA